MARERTIKINITGDASGVKAQLSGLDHVFGAIQQRFVQLLGVAGLFAVIRALKDAAGAAIELSKTFERSMSRIVGLAGESREQVALWKEDLKELAPVTGRGLNELANTLYFVASSGIEASTAMEVVEASGKAAAAGLGEAQVVADATTTAMNAYGEENLSAAEATDILIAAVREGKGEPEEFAESIGRVIPLAAELGVGFDQVAAALASMSLVGLDVAEGATALRGIFATLIKPTHEGAKQLSDMGLSFQDLRDTLREQGLIGLLFSLRDTFGENEEAMSGVFRNVRALTGILNLVGENAEEVEGVFGALEDSTGSLDAAFGAAAETAGFKMEQAMARLQVIGVEVGDDVLPKLVESLEQILPSLIELLPKIGELGVSFLNFAKTTMPLVIEAMETLGTTFQGWGIIFNGITGLWDEGASTTLRQTQAQIALTDALKAGNDPAAALANSLLHLVQSGDLTETEFLNLAATAGISGDRLRDVAVSVIDMNGKTIEAQQHVRELQEIFRAWYEDGIPATRGELEALGVTVGEGSDGYFELGERLRELAPVLDVDTMMMSELGDMMGVTTGRAITAEEAHAQVNEQLAMQKGLTEEAGGGVMDYAADLETMEGRLREAADAQQNLSDAIAQASSPVMQAVSDLKTVQDQLVGFREDGELTDDEMFELWQSGLRLASSWENLSTTDIELALSSLQTSFGLTRDEAIELLDGFGILVDESGTIGTSFEDGIINGFTGMGDRLAAKVNAEVNTAITDIKNGFAIRSPSGVFKDEIGVPLSEGVAEGILEGMKEAESAIQELMDKMQETAEEGLNETLNAISAVISGRSAQTNLAEAKKELDDLKREHQKAASEIAKTQAQLTKSRAKDALVTPEEQVAIERAQENLARVREEHKLGEASAAEVKVAEGELAQARRDAKGPTEETIALQDKLAEQRERQKELPRLIAEAEQDLIDAQLRAIEAQQKMLESGAALFDNTLEGVDAFQRLAQSVGLSRDEIEKLLAILGQARSAPGNFGGIEIGDRLPGQSIVEQYLATRPGSPERKAFVDSLFKRGVIQGQRAYWYGDVQGEDLENLRKAAAAKGLAKGGIVTGAMMSMLGEAGDEAVIPLNNRGVGVLADALKEALGDLVEAPRSPTAGMFDGATLVFQGTPDTLANDIARQIGFEIRWAGG